MVASFPGRPFVGLRMRLGRETLTRGMKQLFRLTSKFSLSLIRLQIQIVSLLVVLIARSKKG